MNGIKQSNTNFSGSNTTAYSIKELNAIYQAVFRNSTSQPGFYYQDLGKQLNSKAFRQRMIELKDGLSYISEQASNKKLNYQSIGRFNHQHSSRFHRDSAEPLSFLMLGYEPTQVESKVYIADYTKLIESQNISLEAYFEGDEGINTAADEKQLNPYVTELSPFSKDNYRLLLLNNSKSFQEKTFGVFHRGEISQKVDQEDRIINYMMLYLCDKEAEEQHSVEAISEFVNTDKVHR